LKFCLGAEIGHLYEESPAIACLLGKGNTSIVIIFPLHVAPLAIKKRRKMNLYRSKRHHLNVHNNSSNWHTRVKAEGLLMFVCLVFKLTKKEFLHPFVWK